jgi:hypothetical protein
MSNISHQIWDMKYRLKAPDGTPIDREVADSWARVALALAQAESPDQRVGRARQDAPCRKKRVARQRAGKSQGAASRCSIVL